MLRSHRQQDAGCGEKKRLMAFRIMMVLTIVRHLTDECYHPMPEGQPLRLECTDEDYHTSLTIAETMLYHSAYMFRMLEKPAGQTSAYIKNDRREILYNMLPDSFTKQEYLSVVRQLEYSESTCNKWIDWYLTENRLKHCGHSRYEKVLT